ncbi:MAG: Maf family protein [Dissulfurispiraceae bacterium]|jgi:septum formation protein
MKKIILASASPRRKEILEKTGLKFRVDESDYEEDMDIGLKPRELAICHSVGKGRAVACRYKNALIISADTIVVLKNKVFGKPRNEKEATQMLNNLSGKSHTVITGYTIIDTDSGKDLSRAIESKVFFKRLNEEEIKTYIRSGEPMDKAGAYGVQGLGAVIVKKIDGDFFNVMGLPLNSLVESLKKFGIKVL